VPFERKNARARSSSSERSDWEAFAVGTDQPVGALVEEILLLHAIEMNTNDAVRASSWIAREVLRFPRLVEGHRGPRPVSRDPYPDIMDECLGVIAWRAGCSGMGTSDSEGRLSRLYRLTESAR